MHVFFYGWFVSSIEFVYVQHILTQFFLFFLLSDSKAICNYNTALFFLKARKLDHIKLLNIKSVNKLGGTFTQRTTFYLGKLCYFIGEGIFWQGGCEKDRQLESDQQEQSCLELIAELKLAQDGVF